jgi:hypothetical protein
VGTFFADIMSTKWLGEVGLRLLALVLAPLVYRVFRRPTLIIGRRIVKMAPAALESAVGRRVDQAYPSWRLKAGMTRGRTNLDWRIQKARASWRRGFFILGGVYLDIMVQNVKVKKLENQEHSDLDRVRCYTGGSACHVGHYLYENFHKKSFLYSRLGGESVLSDELRRLLRREPWIKGRQFQDDKDSQSGVSVHLVQEDGSYRTTFTHKGALDGLHWNPVLRKLVRKTGRGGVLHISGYFRTGLHLELCRSLERLSPNLIVCLDHGRFVPEDHVNQARTLITAFQRGLIDVYVSTFPELQQLMTIAGVTPPRTQRMTDTLRLYAASRKLPSVTIVRGDVTEEKATAHIILNGRLQAPTTVRPGMPRNQDQPGKNNAFNAALAYHLSNGPSAEPLADAVRNSVERALASWIETSRK